MAFALLTLFALLFVYGIYLAVCATYLVVNDPFLSLPKRVVHLVLVWFAPIIGALVVIHLINDYSPETIDKLWLPWPTGWVTRAESFNSNVVTGSLLLGFLAQVAVGYAVMATIFYGWPAWATVGPYERLEGVVGTVDASRQLQPVVLTSGETILVHIPGDTPLLEGEAVRLIRPLRYPFNTAGYIFESYAVAEDDDIK